MDEKRLVHKAMNYMHSHRTTGDLRMDAPKCFTWAELIKLAADRKGWRKRVHTIKHVPKMEIMMNNRIAGARVFKQ